MFCWRTYALVALCAVFYTCRCQDFAAEMTRQCLVPDPVGLVDCVEAKVTLPYLRYWVECTNSLGQNVRTSADIVNYRCKNVWEGKELIPEVFYLKDCVIEKTGLPAKNVSAEVLGAYKDCESAPSTPQQRIKGGSVQQQPMRASSVEYKPPTQQVQVPPPPPMQTPIPVQQVVRTPVPFQPQNVAPRQPFQAPAVSTFQPQLPVAAQRPVQQQFQAPVLRPIQQVPAVRPFQPQQPLTVQRPVQQQFQTPMQRPVQQQQQFQAPMQRPVQQQFQAPMQRPFQQAPAVSPFQPQPPMPVQRPVQQQFQAPVSRPVQQAPAQQARPAQFTQQQVSPAFSPQVPSAVSGPQYPTAANPTNQRQPFSQQFFAIYPQPPLPNQQQRFSNPVLTQKTAPSPAMVPQQQILASAQQFSSINPNVPYSYAFQINHPLRPAA